MVELVEVLGKVISLLVKCYQLIRKAILMALHYSNSLSPPSPPWQRSSELPSPPPKRPKESPDSKNFTSKIQRVCMQERLLGTMDGVIEAKESKRVRKRPARIVVPETCVQLDHEFGEVGDQVKGLIEVEGSEYWVASRKGKRPHVMEDGYGAITNINGDSKQAFFGVFDGHGGRAAVDFVSEKLGKNIIAAVGELEENDPLLELAVKAGYLATDTQFLNQGLSSGTCAATVLLKAGELLAANVGDCKVVVSKKGVADALTDEHRVGREDERIRIERSGGYVSSRNGVWRLNDSLAISRAIGDASMKQWVISEPDTRRLRLTSDCEFLIMASDGLWDKVNEQEAVDVVLKHGNCMQSCRRLVDMSISRGSRDDVVVMVVNLGSFL